MPGVFRINSDAGVIVMLSEEIECKCCCFLCFDVQCRFSRAERRQKISMGQCEIPVEVSVRVSRGRSKNYYSRSNLVKFMDITDIYSPKLAKYCVKMPLGMWHHQC